MKKVTTTTTTATAATAATEVTTFNYGSALNSLVLRINFLKGAEFLTNSEIKALQ